MLSNYEIEELLIRYEKYIKSIVNKYKVSAFDKDDLYQAGLVGLYKAIKNYKDEYNVKLSTYAFKYIIGEINKEYNKLNIYGRSDYNKIRMFIEKNSNLSPEEICKALNITLDTFFKAISKIDKIVYIDEELANQLPSQKTVINDLEDDEMILYNYYFIRKLNQSEIAKLLNISQATVSRNIKKIKLKFKK